MGQKMMYDPKLFAFKGFNNILIFWHKSPSLSYGIPPSIEYPPPLPIDENFCRVLKVISEGSSCVGTFDLWNISGG